MSSETESQDGTFDNPIDFANLPGDPYIDKIEKLQADLRDLRDKRDKWADRFMVKLWGFGPNDELLEFIGYPNTELDIMGDSCNKRGWFKAKPRPEERPDEDDSTLTRYFWPAGTSSDWEDYRLGEDVFRSAKEAIENYERKLVDAMNNWTMHQQARIDKVRAYREAL